MERSAENIKKRMEHMEVKEKPQELPKLRPIFSLTDPPKNPIIFDATLMGGIFFNTQGLRIQESHNAQLDMN